MKKREKTAKRKLRKRGSRRAGGIQAWHSQSPRTAWTPKQSTWLPPKNSYHRGWIAGESDSPWLDVAPLEAREGTSALSGQVLRVNGLPLAGVHVEIEGADIAGVTDESGRFLLRGAPAGHHVLSVDGETAADGDRYGSFRLGFDVKEGETTVLEEPVWITPLDKEGDHEIDSPTRRALRLTNDRIPGFEVRIPAGTRITDDEGRPVNDLNITAIPVDRPAFPLPPFLSVPVYFTVQPGGATLSKGAQIVYPNWGDLPPGKRVEFWNYDPTDRGWYVYGEGTVTPDGEQIMPDDGVRVWEFTGAMASGPPPPPVPPGTAPNSQASGGDPVDLYSGLFTYQRIDLTLPDSIPLEIERTYRPNDSNSYSFGQGTTTIFDLRLWSTDTENEADLILPDGRRIHYVRSYPGGPFETGKSPSLFSNSTVTWNEWSGTWDLELTNGGTFKFNPFSYAPLMAIEDRFGNALRIKRESGLPGDIAKVTTPNGRWAKFTYDGSNRITQITDNADRSVKYTYTSGRLTKVEAPDSRTVQYEYDASGRMKAVINPRGNKFLQNEYDANGRVKKQTTGDGGTFEFAYELDEAGKVKATTITDPRGYKRKVVFDSEGFLVSEARAFGTEAAQTTTFERQEGTGLLLSRTDPLGRKTEFEYDSAGNVTEVTKLAGTEDAVTAEVEYEPGTTNVTKVTDPLERSTTFDYGSKGELLSRSNPLGNETTYAYDAAGRLTEIEDPEGGITKFGYEDGDIASVTDPLGHTSRRFVDALGRLRVIGSPSGLRRLLSYNASDEITSITSPSGSETAIGRDKDGNIVSVDPGAGETTTSYDVMDRPVSQTNPLEDTAEWKYDKAGLMTEKVSRDGDVTKYEYDELGRISRASFGVEGLTAESVVEYAYDDGDRLVGVDDSASGEYTLAYDGLDRLTSISGPTGTVGYAYDDAGRRTSMTLPGQPPVNYEYDDADRLIGLSRGSETVSLAYDGAGRLTELELPNGVEQVYTYDKAGRTTSIAYVDGETTLGDLHYAYDVDGRTKAIWGSFARMGLPEDLSSLKYNAANQLIEREGQALSYDADGNLIDDGASEYEWNARDELAAVDGAVDASFSYDPFGRRISRTSAEATTDFLHDGFNVVQEYEGEELTAALLTGLHLDQLFARTTTAGTDSFLTDRLGTVIGLADGTGEVNTTYTYQPFGVMTNAGDPSDNPFQFTGRENDGTGLLYYRARYYDPSVGRFISSDPKGFAGGFNLYGYVGGNPLDLTDPSGECIYGGPCVPDLWGPLKEEGEETFNDAKDWVSGAPEVASEVGEWGENFFRGAGECGYELLPPYKFESSPCHDFYEESIEELENFGEEFEPEDPDGPKPPLLPPFPFPKPKPLPQGG
ncbi:MAG TPA: RHS repeat-associated core domain-containing protein [Solirubrobacterales bacterium]|nr:RHS repeat-associated core domain-containing protein [Solirubrobacterales bacterium]